MANTDLLENEFELDPELLDNELEEGEQNLEDEAKAMLRAWDRDEFLKEVKDEMEQIRRNRDNKAMDFYDGDQEFDKIADEMTPLEGEQVFMKIIESNPSGKRIFADNTVLFDSVAYLEYELAPFASSIYDGKPSKINLAVGPIIAGLVQALINMREGERANILLRPSMAFGPLGCYPTIPPESSILYQVKVYKVWENSKLETLIETERGEFFQASHEDTIRLVEEHKAIANEYLRDNQIRDAIIRYKMGIKRLDEIPTTFLERCGNGKILMLSLLQNCANALNSLEMHKAASRYAKRALLIEPRSLKGYYQLIKAKIGTGDLDEAQRQLARVDMISPNNSCFNKLKVQLDQMSHSTKLKRDEIEVKMSKGLFSGRS